MNPAARPVTRNALRLSEGAELLFVRCSFCGRNVFFWFYPAHELTHRPRRGDDRARVGAPPAGRHDGSLYGVPQVFVHERCGVATRVPDDTVRAYLARPTVQSDGSFCTGCQSFVAAAELTWQSSGECVLDYLAALRRDYVRREYALDLSASAGRVTLTPPAVAAVHRIAEANGLARYYLLLQAEPPPYTHNHRADIAAACDSRTHLVQTFAGVPVAIRRDQLPRFAGILVDYHPPPLDGFGVCRLWPKASGEE